MTAGCAATPPPAAAEPAPAEAAQPAQAPADAQGQGQDDMAVEDFYEPLSSYGTWVDLEPYGRVWQPGDDVAGDDFTPYASDGSWAANDDDTYVFQSKYDEEFGWATYHYGRWVENDDLGWVWIPGTAWAPSWVDWRYGGGYVGWVPTGPAGVTVNESSWVFVETRSFASPGVYGYRVAPERVHDAYVAATPIVEVRGVARWSVGPAVARLRAEGVVMRTTHEGAPARGAARAHAKRAAKAAAGHPHKTAVHHGHAAAHAAKHAEHKAEHHEEKKAEHHEEKKAEHAEHKAEHHEEKKAEHHEEKKAPPGLPKSKPAPAPAPKKSGKHH